MQQIKEFHIISLPFGLTLLQKGKVVMLFSLQFVLNAQKEIIISTLYKKNSITNMNVIFENINYCLMH